MILALIMHNETQQKASATFWSTFHAFQGNNKNEMYIFMTSYTSKNKCLQNNLAKMKSDATHVIVLHYKRELKMHHEF